MAVLFSQHGDEFVSGISILSHPSRAEEEFSARDEPLDITLGACALHWRTVSFAETYVAFFQRSSQFDLMSELNVKLLTKKRRRKLRMAGNEVPNALPRSCGTPPPPKPSNEAVSVQRRLLVMHAATRASKRLKKRQAHQLSLHLSPPPFD